MAKCGLTYDWRASRSTNSAVLCSSQRHIHLHDLECVPSGLRYHNKPEGTRPVLDQLLSRNFPSNDKDSKFSRGKIPRTLEAVGHDDADGLDTHSDVSEHRSHSSGHEHGTAGEGTEGGLRDEPVVNFAVL